MIPGPADIFSYGVLYELTKLGSTLWEAVEPLSSWARTHLSEILTSRKEFDDDAN